MVLGDLIQSRTARLALPENVHVNSGDSDGDYGEEEGSEEENGDPLAHLPDETEVHLIHGI
jgi:hypothetical protein